MCVSDRPARDSGGGLTVLLEYIHLWEIEGWVRHGNCSNGQRSFGKSNPLAVRSPVSMPECSDVRRGGGGRISWQNWSGAWPGGSHFYSTRTSTVACDVRVVCQGILHRQFDLPRKAHCEANIAPYSSGCRARVWGLVLGYWYEYDDTRVRVLYCTSTHTGRQVVQDVSPSCPSGHRSYYTKLKELFTLSVQTQNPCPSHH
ncbi:hypothetical protein HOY80DRAFT_63889 [Tuber brumale]|nr:hypothetical protein HOY80DRAFT_63889 [Tuber brumale]